MVKHVTQNIIYQGLENSWGVSESKGHYLVFSVQRGLAVFSGEGILHVVIRGPPFRQGEREDPTT